MKKPDARQWLFISECGCDPDRYSILGEDYGWIYCIDRQSGDEVHFDLNRQMPCYPREIKDGGANNDTRRAV